jgi:hypothetical protein
MNNESSQDKKVLDLFMEDGLWLKKRRFEKKEKGAALESTESTTEDKLVRQEATANNETPEKEFTEVDYAVLKSVTYGFKNIKQISKTLQIRAFVVEKHINNLIKDGYIKYFQYCALTSKGKQAIEDFEKNNPEDAWKPIDEFIVSIIERNKEQNLKLSKLIDVILLISIITLIILIIYFGIFS